jgi:murein DD-endopeptidase MepM/ murein hydrolase activator NlpD
MNECKKTRGLLALRPKDWSAEEREQIETHLATCSDCAAIAHAYAEQDRLVRAAPRVGLTPSQRSQLLSRIQQERRRHEMHIKRSVILNTATFVVTLIALALGLRTILPQEGQPTPSILPDQYPTSASAPAVTEGQFQWPTIRHDISGWLFNDPRNPDHPGLDIAAQTGDPIFAVAEGTVSFAGEKGDYGNLVIVDHADDWQSYYAQLSEIAVEVGQQVRQGELLGAAGASGLSSGPHLHFELRYQDQPMDPQAYLSSPPTPETGFELGGHVHDLNLPFAYRLHDARMNWIKTQVHYGEKALSEIGAANAYEFKIQLTALGTPDMVTQPDFEQDFAEWTASLAAAGADAIEVWNEPNIDREWLSGQISPEAYTNLLCTAYRAIKAANSNTLVISAAPAPTGFFGRCTSTGCDDDLWMEGLYAAGAANCMDYIGAHHTAGATAPSARSGHPADPGNGHHSWYFLPQTKLYYDTFKGTRQLFYTEMGYASQEGVPPFPDQFAWASGTTDSQQAAWLAEAAQLSIETGMVRSIIVWNVDFPRYSNDPQDGYAIIRSDGSCPACNALHDVLVSTDELGEITPPAEGYFQWPTAQQKIAGWLFRDPRNPDHIGVDITAETGEPVLAASGGTVTFAGWEDGYGQLVIVEHDDDWHSHYGHLDEIIVEEGQEVQQGELLGRAGSTGWATGPHLHFEVRYQDRPVDPLTYLPISTTYTVQEGDTLLSIAEQYEISAETIRAINGLDDSSLLQVGQELVLPVDMEMHGVSPPSEGYFQWPITPHEISGWTFHDPRNPGHPGLDIGAQTGDPIVAAADGVVTFAGEKGDYGNLVVVEHADGWNSHYAKLSEIVVTVGQQVQQGELLGEAGSTGLATGPHLHFELHYLDHPVNPFTYLP